MKKIIIIGGGFAGATIAKKLQYDFNITLIDSKDYFEFIPSILRTIIEPKLINRIQIKHNEYLKNGKLVVGKVERVNSNSVEVNKKNIDFDYLVIASGSNYNLPIKHKNSISAYSGKALEEYSKRIVGKNVLVVGGGLVGVELAAELANKAKVTIIEGNNQILTRNNIKTQKYATKFLEKNNIRVILGERVIKSSKEQLITDKNNKLKPDYVFLCTGIKPNSEFMRGDFNNSLGKRGHILVNKYLQVRNYDNIFAAGDVTDIVEEKTAQSAEKQAEIIIKNIKILNKNKNNDCKNKSNNNEYLKEYIPKSRPMDISLGKYDGILCYKQITITGIISSLVKYFIELKTLIKFR